MFHRIALVALVVLALLGAVPPVAAVSPSGSRAAAAAPATRAERSGRADDRRDRPDGRRDGQWRAGDAGPRAAPRDLGVGVLAGARDRAVADLPAYNVVLAPSARVPAQAAALAAQFDLTPTYVFRHVFPGFSARMTEAAARQLARDSRVALVSPVRWYRRTGQTVPNGINRVDADLNPIAAIDGVDARVDADIMTIDGGVQLDHPDLNVFAYGRYAGPNYVVSAHATHVAGIAAALDNGIGVVGAAPGARLWAADVFGGLDRASDAAIIRALDDAVASRTVPVGGQAVDVVNLSVGRPARPTTCANDALHAAVCAAVRAGITVVVAAGNDGADAAGMAPANFEQAITVSALEDYDGLPGNDRLAAFSNFGPDVDLAAPGVNVYSTAPGGGYAVMAGTSMAAPHVAGAAALVLAAHPAASPPQVRAALVAAREAVALPGDGDGLAEGVLNLIALGGPLPPAPPNNDSLDAARAVPRLPFRQTDDLSGATPSSADPPCLPPGGPPAALAATVWYTLKLARPAVVTVDTAGSAFDTVVGLYAGPPRRLRQLACNDDRAPGSAAKAASAAPRGTVYLMVAAAAGSSPGLLRLKVTTGPATPGGRSGDLSVDPAAAPAAIRAAAADVAPVEHPDQGSGTTSDRADGDGVGTDQGDRTDGADADRSGGKNGADGAPPDGNRGAATAAGGTKDGGGGRQSADRRDRDDPRAGG